MNKKTNQKNKLKEFEKAINILEKKLQKLKIGYTIRYENIFDNKEKVNGKTNV